MFAVQLNFSVMTVMCNVVALACYNNRVLCSYLDFLCSYLSSVYIFLWTYRRNVTIRYVLVQYPMYICLERRGVAITVLCARFLPVIRCGFYSMKEKIVGNASGLRRLTVFVLGSSAFRSRLKHSGVRCSEQTRLYLDKSGRVGLSNAT